jgi:decaprenylphospho-beta-D-erythro-pentofuranosid-2-ulose 2-reductase
MTNKNYLIIGSNSDIAKSFINQTHNVNFITISKSKLANTDVSISKHYCCNFNDIKRFTTLLEKIFLQDKIDKVLCFYGLIPENSEGFYARDTIENTMNVNIWSYTVLLNFLDQYKKLSINEIVILGSIAGDRGKSKNPLYDGSKAFLHTLTTGYQRRLSRRNINLLLVKPGNVSSKMTNYQNGLLWSQPDRVAKDIFRQLDRHKNEIYSPFWWAYVMFVIRHLPKKFFDFLGLNEANKIR